MIVHMVAHNTDLVVDCHVLAVFARFHRRCVMQATKHVLVWCIGKRLFFLACFSCMHSHLSLNVLLFQSRMHWSSIRNTIGNWNHNHQTFGIVVIENQLCYKGDCTLSLRHVDTTI